MVQTVPADKFWENTSVIFPLCLQTRALGTETSNKHPPMIHLYRSKFRISQSNSKGTILEETWELHGTTNMLQLFLEQIHISIAAGCTLPNPTPADPIVLGLVQHHRCHSAIHVQKGGALDEAQSYGLRGKSEPGV